MHRSQNMPDTEQLVVLLRVPAMTSRGKAVQITKNEGGGVLRIAGTLDIGGAEELQKALREFLEEQQNPALDLSEVEGCDTATLQLLYAARKTRGTSMKRRQFEGLSSPVANTSSVLGLSVNDLAAPASAGTPGRVVDPAVGSVDPAVRNEDNARAI